MDKQERYDRYFMDIAKRSAEMSYAEKKKVGCVIVRDNHIIAACEVNKNNRNQRN